MSFILDLLKSAKCEVLCVITLLYELQNGSFQYMLYHLDLFVTQLMQTTTIWLLIFANFKDRKTYMLHLNPSPIFGQMCWFDPPWHWCARNMAFLRHLKRSNLLSTDLSMAIFYFFFSKNVVHIINNKTADLIMLWSKPSSINNFNVNHPVILVWTLNFHITIFHF